ncbi:MAG TPA: hypothetical protein ENJ82_18480 [Bacteroidetes bacterium]|nr:hypothetical protein [Bacteroidota bacterium]
MVLKDLQKVQLILAKTADIVQNIDDVLQVKRAGNTVTRAEVTFQEVNAYYGFILDLLDNGLDLTQLVKAPTAQIQRTLDKVIAPLGADILGMVEGISTQQYGLVITNSISLLRLLNDEVVHEEKLQKSLEAAEEVLKGVGEIRDFVKAFDGKGEDLERELDSLIAQLLRAQEAQLGVAFQALLEDMRNLIRDFEGNDLAEMKGYFKQELKALEKALVKEMKKVDLLEELAENFNVYGRLMVNILTAKNSEDVRLALNNAAAPVGSFMVKQSRRSSITLSFFPGVEAGYEYASGPGLGANALVGTHQAYLGATLPIGLEFALGVRSRLLGAVGLHLQIADLGAALNFRLANPGDSISISPEIGFAQVLSPGATLVLHPTKLPIVIGGGLSYSPQLRSLTTANSQLNVSMLQIGGFVAVDVTVFQLFTSKRKIRPHNARKNR